MRKTDEPEFTASSESQPNGAEGEEARLGPVGALGAVEPLDQTTRADLIANLAHDLRTPFVSIRGYTKMILEERAGPINGTQREYLTIVAENTNRAIQLLDDLLQLTMNQPLHLETLDVRDVWREVLGLTKPRALRKSVRITDQISPEPLVILGDRQRLQEAFADLLSAAVKSADQGGEIVAELSNSNGGGVTVRISDTVAAVPARVSDKVVQDTRQGEASTSDTRENLGSGLAAVSDIIQSHGGRISVSSKAREGVTFLVTFPPL